MRIELTELSHCAALRDYFLRLGADVQTNGGVIEIQFPDGLLQEDESPEMYLQTWVRYKRLDVLHLPRVEDRGRPTPEAGEPLGVVSYPSHSGRKPPLQPDDHRTTQAPVDQEPDPVSHHAGSGAKPPLRLGDLLISKGLINEDQLSRALVESRRAGDVLGRVLVRQGAIFESELARVLAEQWSIPYVNLASVGVDRSALVLLPREVGVRYAAVPVRFFGSELRVAFADPSDPESVSEVQARLAAPVEPAIAEISDIDAVWRSVAA